MEKKNIVAHFVSMRRVARVNKGGKTHRSSVLVVVGDEGGSVGYGLGKSVEVPEAIKKATRAGEKRMKHIKLLQGRTIPFDVKAKYCSSLVYLRKAKPGTGIIAGGVARFVFEALGIKDIVCKVIGRNAINNVRAIFTALSQLKSPDDIARMRSIPKSQLFYEVQK